MEDKYNYIKVSVRNLVEFILRSGSIDNSQTGMNDPSLMQQGSKLHRKIQKSMGANYSAEVSLSLTTVVVRDGDGSGGSKFEICVEGRADGIIAPDESASSDKSYIKENGKFEERSLYIIDEIKGVMRDVEDITEAVREHLGQAKCYAYMYALQNNLGDIKVRITYCNLESEQTKYFSYKYKFDELREWYESLLSEYAKWAKMRLDWARRRDESIKNVEFPFEYRPGQRDLAAAVYTSIVREKKIYIEAPTGIGKTISTVFPAVKAMGEGLLDKIFYLTAKTITRTSALNTFTLLRQHFLQFKTVVITAKDKVCVIDKPQCNPSACERADGHFDRVNDAVYDMLTGESDISREVILEYAQKYNVCPFEMCLDATMWVDAIICDYNYAFDPDVYLRRFFVNDKKNDYVFLIDEAHNLVDRARGMYSARLTKEDFPDAKKYIKTLRPKLAKSMDACNKIMLGLKRQCDGCEVLEISQTGSLYMALLGLLTEFDRLLHDRVKFEGDDIVLDLFFSVRSFLNVYECLDDDYLIYDEFDDAGNFSIILQCMNPSRRLREYLGKGRCSVFFSATLLPVNYYKEQLASDEQDYAIYVPSPFDSANRLLMVANNVSTKYTRRNDDEYKKMLDYICSFIGGKRGNYLIFFPSYKMMEDIYRMMETYSGDLYDKIILQQAAMSEQEREEFLESFDYAPSDTHIGFCVMGGIFSEGIDLVGDRLIGAVIVGAGLPMVCNERELFRGYFDDANGCGFEYAYLYDGMNKVMQSAGRVIRTKEDRGAVLLLDERFMTSQYTCLFPREWYPYEIVGVEKMKRLLNKFWNVDKEDA